MEAWFRKRVLQCRAPPDRAAQFLKFSLSNQKKKQGHTHTHTHTTNEAEKKFSKEGVAVQVDPRAG